MNADSIKARLKIDRRILVTSVVSKPGFFITKLPNKYSKST